VAGMVGETAKPPPSMLYCVVNPATVVTDGSVKAAAQVFAGAVMTGAVGKTTKELVPAQVVVAV
jgi:hypothetical protein